MESLNESNQSLSKEESFTNLPERDKAFAVEYITNGFNHAEAAVAVGLSKKSGISKLRSPLVAKFIAHLQASTANAKIITQEFVEAKYLEILPKLMGEEDVPLFDHKEGVTVNAKKFHSAETVSVLRDLGKAAGYVAPDGPKGGNVNVIVDLGGFTGQPNITVIEETDDD